MRYLDIKFANDMRFTNRPAQGGAAADAVGAAMMFVRRRSVRAVSRPGCSGIRPTMRPTAVCAAAATVFQPVLPSLFRISLLIVILHR